MGGETENVTRALPRSRRRDQQSGRSGPIDDPVSGQPDFPDIVREAVQELSRRVGGASFGAWWGQPDREAPECLIAQQPDPDSTGSIGTEPFTALAKLSHPSDLGERSLAPQLLLFAKRSGCSAAVALKATDPALGRADEDVFVLAVGGPSDQPGTVRPRTLAALGETRDKLQRALDERSALNRLSSHNATIDDLNRRAALGELITEIVHEVRNPLVSVKTFLELLPSRLDEADFVENFREVVIGEVARLERLVDTVLQQARPVSGQPTADSTQVADSFERIRRLVSYRARERQIQIEHTVPASFPAVNLPSDVLDQIVLNLVLNALDAVPSGGRIEMSASAQIGQHEVEIRIEDDGPGIPAQDRERIFEHFHSTRADRPGGLGLSISQRLARASGGKIEAGESPRGGASLRLRVPVSAQDPSR